MATAPQQKKNGTVPVLGAMILVVALVVSALLDQHRSDAIPLTVGSAKAASRTSAACPSLGGPSGSTLAMRPGLPTLAEAPKTKPDAPKDKNDKGKPGQKRPDLPIYTSFLKDPASLGFEPDINLFRQIYTQVKHQHIDNDTDEKLFAGVAKEVERLLKEAAIPAPNMSAVPRNLSMPEQIAGLLEGKVNRSVLYYAMIRGLLEGTDDPYTVLMTPKEYHQLMEQMQNEKFGGIGIYIELDRDNHDQLTVVEPVEGTPAYEAGLLPGDEILKINGKSTEGIGLDSATSNIRGPEGSPVVLTIRRKGVDGTKDYRILRAQIQVASLTHKMLPGQIGFVKLRLFGARTGAELTAALAQLQSQGARALIMDLRNNGGGYINASIDVCSHFVKPDALVTYVTDRAGTRKNYNALNRSPVELPVVLLVNGYSASASEITAGCLKDYHVATLIGSKTFGKGSVQQLYPLPNGAALKITVAHFFTPDGAKINKVGVQPDIKLEMEPRLVGRGDKDLQLQKAIEYLQTKGNVKGK